MSATLRIVMAQLNLLVGDVAGNLEQIIAATTRSRDEFHAQLVVFPELTLTSYPPEDLLFHSGLRHAVEDGVQQLIHQVQGIRVLVGYPLYEDGRIYNVGSVIGEGKRLVTYKKLKLPNYSVFDEMRYFTPGTEAVVLETAGVPIGFNICEDIWHPEPQMETVAAGARLLVVTNASPFEAGKQQQREQLLRERVALGGVPILYVNHVGGQDELVFDGGSLAVNANGQVAVRAPNFETGLYPVDFQITDTKVEAVPGHVHLDSSIEETVYKAIVLGVRDYARKNHFESVLVGLSGGIDSALTLAIAVDALGQDQVMAVMMPSRYTSSLSIEQAARQAANMGVDCKNISIEPLLEAFQLALKDALMEGTAGVTEQNLQARCRGVLLMAISNRSGRLLLSTGNKSELAVGYATLYGDMAGGFAPLKDVTKTKVYELARYRNGISPVIPQAVIERAPSAELAHGQTDADTLPPYEVLDPILSAYVEEDRTVAEITALGYDAATVKRVVKMVQNAEYKRRQSPPGVRVSHRAFGRDRRYPITSGYRR